MTDQEIVKNTFSIFGKLSIESNKKRGQIKWQKHFLVFWEQINI